MNEQESTHEAEKPRAEDRGHGPAGGPTSSDAPPGPTDGPSGRDAANAPDMVALLRARIGDLFAQASDVIARPTEFFAELPREGGLWRATGFVLAMGLVGGVLGVGLGVLPAFRSIFTTPLAAFALTVVSMFVIHVLAMLAGGCGSLDASYRLAAYLIVFVPLVIVASALPYLNVAMAGYGVYALIVGVSVIHGLDERRAWSVFGAVGAIGLLLLLLHSVGDPTPPASILEDLRQLRR
jgi:hypothetical protein